MSAAPTMTALPAGWTPSTSASALAFRPPGRRRAGGAHRAGSRSRREAARRASRAAGAPRADNPPFVETNVRRPPWSCTRSSSSAARSSVAWKSSSSSASPRWSTRGRSHWPGCTTTFTAAAFELGEAQLEPDPVELLPGDAGLERRQVAPRSARGARRGRSRACRGSAPRPAAPCSSRGGSGRGARKRAILEWRDASLLTGRSTRSSLRRSCSSAWPTASALGRWRGEARPVPRWRVALFSARAAAPAGRDRARRSRARRGALLRSTWRSTCCSATSRRSRCSPG